MASALLSKMHRRIDDHVLLASVPESLVAALSQQAAAVTIGHSDNVARAGQEFGAIHLFVRSRTDLDAQLPALQNVLARRGRLWVAWPKGRRDGTDLTLPEVIRIAYDHNLVESTTIAVDAYWSAIKLTHPIPGKTYNNSYGTLPTAVSTPQA